MISAETLAEVEKREWKYILGVRMRSSTEAKAVVARAGRSAEVHPQSDDRNDPSPLKVKEVWVLDTRRYVVCVNEDQATKDRHDREAVVASLREALGHGAKSLVGNKGYRKYGRASPYRYLPQLPFTVKPIHSPSGEKKGSKAPSVPTSGTALAVSS